MRVEIAPAGRKMAKGRATRLGWILIGHTCLGVGLLGVAIPLLPTTVFVLLAASCYARGSKRFYTYLLTHHIFGTIIKDWSQHRAMSARVKRWAIASVLISITASTLAVDSIWLRAALVVIALLVIAGLLRIPTRKD